MANTSLSLGEHWEVFIRNEVASGRYGSASEVVRDALRNLEERKVKLAALRGHLAEGATQAARGEFATPPLADMLEDCRKPPMTKANLTLRARKDLRGIWRYSARTWNEAQADAYVTQRYRHTAQGHGHSELFRY